MPNFQEIKLIERIKEQLKDACMEAWEKACQLEASEIRIGLNLEFKKEVLAVDKRCVAPIRKMDTGVSYKVDPAKGPEK